jgi:hypothetical protein
LTPGKRGKKVGGNQLLPDNSYYGCCACIGAAGIGLVPKIQLVADGKALVLNMFVNGVIKTQTPSGNAVELKIDTKYPVCGNVNVSLALVENEVFSLRIRKPEWSKNTVISVNGEEICACSDGYITIDREWADGDRVELKLDMRTEAIYPIPYGSQVLMNKVIWGHNYMIPTYDAEDPIAHRHIALRRGPIMLAQENRLGYSVDEPVTVAVNADGYVDAQKTDVEIPYECILKMGIPLDDGTLMTVTDYASAGKTWTEESKMAVWMLTK